MLAWAREGQIGRDLVDLHGAAPRVEEHEARIVVAEERAGVEHHGRAERADQALVGVAADDEGVAGGDEVREIGVDLERVAIVVRAELGHVAFAEAVAEKKRAGGGGEFAGGRERCEKRARRVADHEGRVGERAHLVREEPALVVAAHREHAVIGEQGAAAIDVAAAIGDIADREDRVDAWREECEDRGEEVVLGMDVADQAEAHGDSVARMAKVLGIGGVFVRAKDPGALRNWYRDMLGITMEKWGGAKLTNEAGTYGVWSPFKSDSTYFDGPFMLNLRVDDAAALVVQLKEKGANVLDRGEDSELGKFRYVVDPEGLVVELWEPPAPK